MKQDKKQAKKTKLLLKIRATTLLLERPIELCIKLLKKLKTVMDAELIMRNYAHKYAYGMSSKIKKSKFNFERYKVI